MEIHRLRAHVQRWEIFHWGYYIRFTQLQARWWKIWKWRGGRFFRGSWSKIRFRKDWLQQCTFFESRASTSWVVPPEHQGRAAGVPLMLLCLSQVCKEYHQVTTLTLIYNATQGPSRSGTREISVSDPSRCWQAQSPYLMSCGVLSSNTFVGEVRNGPVKKGSPDEQRTSTELFL